MISASIMAIFVPSTYLVQPLFSLKSLPFSTFHGFLCFCLHISRVFSSIPLPVSRAVSWPTCYSDLNQSVFISYTLRFRSTLLRFRPQSSALRCRLASFRRSTPRYLLPDLRSTGLSCFCPSSGVTFLGFQAP